MPGFCCCTPTGPETCSACEAEATTNIAITFPNGWISDEAECDTGACTKVDNTDITVSLAGSGICSWNYSFSDTDYCNYGVIPPGTTYHINRVILSMTFGAGLITYLVRVRVGIPGVTTDIGAWEWRRQESLGSSGCSFSSFAIPFYQRTVPSAVCDAVGTPDDVILNDV